jgi:hypothetical protein
MTMDAGALGPRFRVEAVFFGMAISNNVMPGLVPGVRVFGTNSWMAGTSAAMTIKKK